MSLKDTYEATGFVTLDEAESAEKRIDGAVMAIEPEEPENRGGSMIVRKDADHWFATHELKPCEEEALRDYLQEDSDTVEDSSVYKANRVSERLVTDKEDVWVKGAEDNRISADEHDGVSEAIDKAEQYEGLSEKVDSLLDELGVESIDSAEGVECLENVKKLTKSSVNLVTDGTDLWYEGYDGENDRITLEQARDALEAIENGAEKVSFENDVSIEEQGGGVHFHYSDGRRAIRTECLKDFIAQ